MPGRLRTASSPLRTWIDSALYFGCDAVALIVSHASPSATAQAGQDRSPPSGPGNPADLLDRPWIGPALSRARSVGAIRLSSLAHGGVATRTRSMPSARDRFRRGNRRDLRPDQRGPFLNDPRLLHPLGEPACSEVAGQRVGERRGPRYGRHSSPAFPSHRSAILALARPARSTSAGSSSGRGAGDEDLPVSGSAAGASRCWRSPSSSAKTSSSSSAGSVAARLGQSGDLDELERYRRAALLPGRAEGPETRPPISSTRSSRCGPTVVMPRAAIPGRAAASARLPARCVGQLRLAPVAERAPPRSPRPRARPRNAMRPRAAHPIRAADHCAPAFASGAVERLRHLGPPLPQRAVPLGQRGPVCGQRTQIAPVGKREHPIEILPALPRGPEASPTSAGRNATASQCRPHRSDAWPPRRPLVIRFCRGRAQVAATGRQAAALDRRPDVEPASAEAGDLLVGGSPERPEQHRVVDRFQEVRLPLAVGAEEHHALRRSSRSRASRFRNPRATRRRRRTSE